MRRHTLSDRVVHWGVALSIFLLLFSGFGQMPMYKRYKVADLPGLAWSADYGATLLLHYIGAAVLIGVAAYHVLFNLRTRRLGLLPRRAT